MKSEIDLNTLRQWLEQMWTIRFFEENRNVESFHQGLFTGSHPSEHRPRGPRRSARARPSSRRIRFSRPIAAMATPSRGGWT